MATRHLLPRRIPVRSIRLMPALLKKVCARHYRQQQRPLRPSSRVTINVPLLQKKDGTTQVSFGKAGVVDVAVDGSGKPINTSKVSLLDNVEELVAHVKRVPTFSGKPRDSWIGYCVQGEHAAESKEIWRRHLIARGKLVHGHEACNLLTRK